MYRALQWSNLEVTQAVMTGQATSVWEGPQLAWKPTLMPEDPRKRLGSTAPPGCNRHQESPQGEALVHMKGDFTSTPPSTDLPVVAPCTCKALWSGKSPAHENRSSLHSAGEWLGKTHVHTLTQLASSPHLFRSTALVIPVAYAWGVGVEENCRGLFCNNNVLF